MPQEFKDWAENHGIKLQLIAKDAHHQLGMLERNHQVRREQLSIYKNLHKKDSLWQAVRMTTPQINRLLNVRSYSPIQLVLGVVPRPPGAAAYTPMRWASWLRVGGKMRRMRVGGRGRRVRDRG